MLNQNPIEGCLISDRIQARQPGNKRNYNRHNQVSCSTAMDSAENVRGPGQMLN